MRRHSMSTIPKNELATSMIFCDILDEVFLMISSSNFANEGCDRLKEIYLNTKLSRRFTILQKLWQSHQEKNESVAIYLNKIIGLRSQLIGCGCNWINDEFMIFIILQSLASKFNHFMIVIETKLDDEKEVISLKSLSRLILKHEETFNKSMLIPSPKAHFVALGPMKTQFNKKFKSHKKFSPTLK